MEIIKIRENKEFVDESAKWFHSKWEIPSEAYVESMEESFNNDAIVPQWYIAIEKNKIIGGIGVIENDFHDRKDLTPNVCALYVEENYRSKGISGKLLDFVCDDMNHLGIDTLYLITDHTSFYERYNWEFLCMVQEDDEPELTRMYIHKM